MNHSYLRKVRLIAWAHFTAILKAKAFWLGVLMTPAIGVAMVAIIRYAENSQPIRYVVVVDKTDQYRDAIGDSITKSLLQRSLKDYATYFAKYKAGKSSSGVAQAVPVQQSQETLDQYLNGQTASVEAQVTTLEEMNALVANSRSLLRADAPAYALPKQRFVLVDTPADLFAERSATDFADTVRSYVLGARKVQVDDQQKNVDAIAIIEADSAAVAANAGAPLIRYWGTNLTNSALANVIQSAVDQRLRQQLLLAGGIDMSALKRIEGAKAKLLQFDAKKQKGDEGRTLADRMSIAVPIFFAIALFMILMISVSILLQGIVEEKSNRLIEVMLSSVTPTQLMAGKLLGVAAISVVSIATWLALAIAGAYFGFGASGAMASAGNEAIAAASVSTEQIDAVMTAIGTGFGLLPIFLFCFLCGYLIYASLILAIGSLCSSPREANTLVTPLMFLMMVPLFLMRFFITDPNGAVATVFTWIPLYTPFAIVVRMSANPPLAELIGSALIMVAMTALALWMSARIFRYGVLYSGETPKLLQVLRLAFVKQSVE
jgi:ABC-2 type transport system permease protein